MSFWCLQFSQKNELENSNFCPSLLGQKFFVCFLEELEEQNVLSKFTDLYVVLQLSAQFCRRLYHKLRQFCWLDIGIQYSMEFLGILLIPCQLKMRIGDYLIQPQRNLLYIEHLTLSMHSNKVEKIEEKSLDSIPSPSPLVKIIYGKV